MKERVTHCVWQYTLDLLERVSSSNDELERGVRKRHDGAGVVASHTYARSAVPPASAHLEIIERHSEDLVTVCCCDATTGRYGEQWWKLASARGRGVCALSGAIIRRGDRVYRPYMRGHIPSNADWMVLASAMPEDCREGVACAA
jgi:hypothetical protein